MIILVLVLCVPLLSWAEQSDAVDYSTQCIYGVDPGIANSQAILTDDLLTTHIATNGRLYIRWDEEVPVRQLYLELAKQHQTLTIVQYDKDRNRLKSEDITDGILDFTYALEEGTVRVRLSSTDKLDVSTLLGLGEGDWDVYRYLPIAKQAGCMVITAHVDDAVSYMGGVIASCVDRDIDVSVVCVATDKRVLTDKALEALGKLELKNHPTLMGYSEWDTDQFKNNSPLKRLVQLIRTQKPDVIVAPSFEGESDHWQHEKVAALISEAVSLAADASYDTSTEVWQVKTLYNHLAADNPVKLDVLSPLDCYSGKTALEQVELAYSHLLDEGREPESISVSGSFSLSDFNLSFEFEGGATDSNPFNAVAVETPAPTAEPTNEPTAEPTTEPSVEPTSEPTSEPTAEPTNEPTAEPTASPTEKAIAPTAATTGGGCNLSFRTLLQDRTILILIVAVVALLIVGAWKLLTSGFKPRKKSRRDSKPSSKD